MTEPTPASNLQFEKAEVAAPEAFRCAECTKAIATTYFEVNGRTLCPSCRSEVERAATVGAGGGRRFLRALLYGGGTAVLGAVAWYAIGKLTGYELGILSIAVGIGVGMAVRKGSANRGGWLYQTLAVVLTYNAITLSNLPDVLEEFRKMSKEEPAAVVSTQGGAADAVAPAAPPSPSPDEASPAEEEGPTAAPSAPSSGEAAAPTAEAPASGAGAADGKAEKLTGGALAALAFFALFVLGICWAAPFLSGFQPIGWAIIAFGLWEAWKRNKREPLVVSGPFEVKARVESPVDRAANG